VFFLLFLFPCFYSSSSFPFKLSTSDSKVRLRLVHWDVVRRLIVEVSIVLLEVKTGMLWVNIVVFEVNAVLLHVYIVLLDANIVVLEVHIVLLEVDNMYSGGADSSHLPVGSPMIAEEERHMSTLVRQWSYTQRA
jgi:hypothetical protein